MPAHRAATGVVRAARAATTRPGERRSGRCGPRSPRTDRRTPSRPARCSHLTEASLTAPSLLGDDDLTGALEAARRLQNRAHYLETLAIADLARRRAEQHQQDTADGVPRNQRRAEFPDLELAAQLLVGRRHAQCLLDEATELTTRLPLTLAGMADGLIDAARASAIASATLCLGDADAARADQVLAPGAHEARADTVARRATALVMRLDPEAARREREDARRTRQHTEARREQSGNVSFSIREAETPTVLAVKAAIVELAVKLRNGGAAEATLAIPWSAAGSGSSARRSMQSWPMSASRP